MGKIEDQILKRQSSSCTEIQDGDLQALTRYRNQHHTNQRRKKQTNKQTTAITNILHILFGCLISRNTFYRICGDYSFETHSVSIPSLWPLWQTRGQALLSLNSLLFSTFLSYLSSKLQFLPFTGFCTKMV